MKRYPDMESSSLERKKLSGRTAHQMSFKNVLDETQFLVSSLLLHLYENALSSHPLSYEKKSKKVVDEPKPVNESVARAPAPPAAVPKKQEPAPASPPKPAPSLPQEPQLLPPAHPLFPFVQTLSSAMAKPEAPHLDNMIEKIKQFGGACLCSEALKTEELLSWKEEYPEVAVVSFFAKESQEELFLRKVTQAIASRLSVRAAFFSTPSLQTAAELSCFSSSKVLKIALFVYSPSLQQKMHEWLTFFPSLEAVDLQQEVGPLILKKKLFSTPLYQLVLPPFCEQDADFKAALWKALQQLLS
jgi:hypothetical protein